tara:strand:+ start:507 stop:1784 length:1278 start_codon:yes stop_codon:yes gene_type:complete
MLTLFSNNYGVIISSLVLFTLFFLGYLFVGKKQDVKLNWAMFYSTLYISIALSIVNYLCVKFNLWHFTEEGVNAIKLPFNILFLWVVLWGIVPVLIFKGKYLLLMSVLMFWLDILIMPVLEELGILVLNEKWFIGELILIAFVFIPGYFWSYCSLNNKYHGLRAIFQIAVMTGVFLIGLPFILMAYGLVETIDIYATPFILQLFLMLVFPALVAVFDLVKKGEGTPFPYDPTQKLIRTGVYAYCRNPIQWSFTLMFIPLSIYYESLYFLIGTIFSIAYAFGVSDYQEYADMELRFGKVWDAYKKEVPKWRFLWRPKTIPVGTVYFDANCNQCSEISKWFSNSKAINLDIKSSSEFPKSTILQVTYIDHNGIEFKSVSAIACCLEHINLAYATLAWFMRFPGINQFLQLIIDTMELGGREENCDVK